MRLDLLASLNAERAARRAAVIVTELESGAQRLVRESEIESDPLADILRKQLRIGKGAKIELAGKPCFLEVHLPPASMVITGAVHISQLLGPVARALGYRVTIIDPRTAFATPDRFPDVPLIAEWPDQAFAKVPLDRWTAFVALTHDPKIDEPAIETALNADCFYVGALGSKKTHAKRLERLAARGVPADRLARIHAPIGLSIGAATPGEIAISILAEITALRRLGLEAKP